MEDRYIVEKSGYVSEDPSTAEQLEVDAVRIGVYINEKSALSVLKTLDHDYHYIRRLCLVEYEDGWLLDWEADEEYGTKWMWDFKEKKDWLVICSI